MFRSCWTCGTNWSKTQNGWQKYSHYFFILADGYGQLIILDIASTELASLFFIYFVFNYFSRLAEICAAIEEMERRQREAELRRLKAQNQEWIKDFRPEGAAEFGSMPSFRWVQML